MSGVLEMPQLHRESDEEKKHERQKIIVRKISELLKPLDALKMMLEKQVGDKENSLIDLSSFASAVENLRSALQNKHTGHICDALERLSLIIKSTGELPKFSNNVGKPGQWPPFANYGPRSEINDLETTANELISSLETIYKKVVSTKLFFREDDPLSQTFLKTLESLQGATAMRSDGLKEFVHKIKESEEAQIPPEKIRIKKVLRNGNKISPKK